MSKLHTTKRLWTHWREEVQKDQGAPLADPGICGTTQQIIQPERWELQGWSENRIFKREQEVLDRLDIKFRLVRCLGEPGEPSDDSHNVSYGDGKFGAFVRGKHPRLGGGVITLSRKWFVVFSIDTARSYGSGARRSSCTPMTGVIRHVLDVEHVTVTAHPPFNVSSAPHAAC